MLQTQKNVRILLLLKVLLLLCSCQSQPQHRISISGKALGTYYSVHLYHKDNGKLFQDELQSQIDSLLAGFNAVASIYDPESVISKINSNQPYEMNKLFADVFLRSAEISELSGGAFDITVGPLVNAWGFGFTDSMHITKEFIDSIIQFTGYKKVRLVNDEITKDDPRIMLDMNGIAKGYAVDIVALFLESKNIVSYIVEIGGEVRTGKEKPDGSKWVIAIEKPAENAASPQQEEKRVFLENISVATSGSYRRYYERDGARYSHTIDPKTGRPVSHSMLSATIIASNCMTADALATACMVLGLEDAISLCESFENVEGYFIVAGQNDTYFTYYTSGFEKFLANE
jgi:FAD:protein FMN transferase